MSPASAARELTKPKARCSQLRANWGPLFTKRLPVRNLFAEPNIRDFEILSATLVNHGTRFSGENGQNCENALPTDNCFGARTSSLSSLRRALKVTFLCLSVYLWTFG
jgi:hypothetical protein